ncbi:MAG: WYL domain-containing protein, partial [Planctomycetota bacterium]|nr:WYL domain-containing protein [Planctomycetota bacterium]
CVSFSYYTFSRNSLGHRKVDPYGMALVQGAWYIVGYSYERKEVRSFRVDRVQGEVKVFRKKHTFTPPEGFRIERFVRKRPWEMAEGKPVKAVIRFHPDIAWMIRGELGHHEPLKEDGDGWGRLHMDVYAPERLFTWVLQYGEQAEIVSPAPLRRSMHEMLQVARAKYGR